MNKPSILLTLVFALFLLTTACTTRVTGHTSPIAHDYGPVEWRALQQPVIQQFVTGPGHQAAIANDGRTTAAQFQERLAALPEDARTGTLLEIQIGLQLADDAGIEEFGNWNTGAIVRISGPDDALLYETPVDALPRDGDWLRIEEPPTIADGQIVTLRIDPGDGPDAGRLHYGVTRDRAPYGGWIAIHSGGESAGGGLLLRTTYERDVNLRSMASDTTSRLRGAFNDDLAFGVVWAVVLTSLLATAGWVWRLQQGREG